jgi:hypothetical protein
VHDEEQDVVINVGGWLALSAIFAVLLLLVQRAERSRRIIALVVMAAASWLVGGYGVYRISRECEALFRIMCEAEGFQQRAQVTATNTVTLAVVTAILFNILFWVFIGRYNPPHSSETDIKVLGLDD